MKISLIAIILILLGGCAAGRFQETDYPQKSIAVSEKYLNIDLPPHNGPVDIFLPGQNIPDSMILTVNLVEQYSRSVSYETAIQELKETARKRGMDGVVLLERNFVNRSYDDYSNTAQVVTGEGFIYKHNLSRVTSLPKTRHFEIMTDSGWVAMAEANYHSKARILPIVYHDSNYEFIMREQVEPFDYTTLLSQGGKGWEHKIQKISTPKSVRVTKRKRSLSPSNGRVWLSNSLVINDFMEAQYMTMKHTFRVPQASLSGEKVTYRYLFKKTPDCRHIQKIQITKDGTNAPMMKQYFKYDESGKQLGSIWYKIDEQGHEVPFVRTHIHYYEPSDFIPSLKFAPDIPMRADRTNANNGRGK